MSWARLNANCAATVTEAFDLLMGNGGTLSKQLGRMPFSVISEASFADARYVACLPNIASKACSGFPPKCDTGLIVSVTPGPARCKLVWTNTIVENTQCSVARTTIA